MLLHQAHSVEHAAVVAVGGIQYHHVHLGLYQGGYTVQHVLGGADGSAAQQTAALVTGGVGILHSLLNVFDGDKSLQVHVLVHQGELFNAVMPQDLLGFFECGTHRSGDQVVLGHHVFDGLVKIAAFHETHVPVGDDAHQHAVLADGHAGDLEPAHDLVGFFHQVVRPQEEGVDDNAVFRTLYPVHLVGLALDAHILVDDADTAFTGNGDGHVRLRHRIHGGGHDGGIQPDGLCQVSGEIHLAGQHVGLGRNQQHVVVGEAFFQKLLSVLHETTLSFSAIIFHIY